ncbi:MAG TPA: DUF4870 domain-containing protein [Ornithinibacter sp.]|jgi:uncharacterized Tic20 family protein|nr:DUF4870 domain-containing protein [Ornithinibacter sp.]
MSDTTPRHDDHPVDPTASFEPVTGAAPTTEQTEVVPELPAPEHTEFVPAAPAPAPVAPSAHEAQPQAQAQPQYQQQSPPAPGYAVAPAPMKPTDERTAGMAAHGGTLAATILSSGTLGFVCALVLYLVFRDRGPFVRHHAANALNVQITAGIAILLGIVLTITIIGAIIGIPLMIAAVVWAIIVHIIGAVKANNGEWWSPALTPQFVK